MEITKKQKKKIEFIKAYLESKGIKFEGTDGVEIGILEFGTRVYLEYCIDLDKEHGIIIYDTEENKVLFENLDVKSCTLTSYFWTSRYNNAVRYNNLKEDQFFYNKHIFIADDNNIILNVGGYDPKYVHYTMFNGEFKEKHTFTEDDILDKSKMYDKSFSKFTLLETGTRAKLGTCYGRLYNITKGEYINDLEFGRICDINDFHTTIHYFGCKSGDVIESVSKILKDNHALIGFTNIPKEDNGRRRFKSDVIHTMVYLNTKGNIDSSLIYYLDCRDRVSYTGTSTETYEKTLEKIKKHVLKEELLAIKDEDEEARRIMAENERREKERQTKAKRRLTFIRNSFEKGKKNQQ